MQIDPALVKELAPHGALRASINLGNAVLANRHPATGAPVGVSVDLAAEFARRLGLALQTTEFDNASKAADAITAGQVDIGFLAIDPKRGEGIAFAPPYIQIEGSYLVRADSPLQANDEVDRAGQRIVVAGGSAYDLYLSRVIRHAELVRVATSQEVVDAFLAQGREVAAGVRQQLESDARRLGGVRLLPGRFMVINQAVGIPKARSRAALQCVVEFVEEMKAGGFVAEAMRRHGIEGAAVAPAGYPEGVAG